MYVQLCSGIVLLYIHAMLNPSLPFLKYILHGIILADETNIYLDYTVCYFLDWLYSQLVDAHGRTYIMERADT